MANTQEIKTPNTRAQLEAMTRRLDVSKDWIRASLSLLVAIISSLISPSAGRSVAHVGARNGPSYTATAKRVLMNQADYMLVAGSAIDVRSKSAAKMTNRSILGATHRLQHFGLSEWSLQTTTESDMAAKLKPKSVSMR